MSNDPTPTPTDLPRRPSGMAFPAVSSPITGASGPVPVVLNWGTILRILIPVLGALISIATTAMYFYFETSEHLEDRAVHLQDGERSRLETKVEAQSARQKLGNDINQNTDLKFRELQLKQAKEIQDLGRKLRHEQRRVLKEVKKIQ